jgi:nucleoside-diphosphate-sugar epimerase
MSERHRLAGVGNAALVGATGFVGGNLLAARDFDVAVGSAGVGELKGGHFDVVVFSAARAEKWRINQDPEADLAHMRDLEAVLRSFATRRLVLISTVDVYADPAGVDEATPVDTDGLHSYGLHRYRLEEFARNVHEDVTVVRLPGLFGPGLKKNVVFDLLTDNRVEALNPGTSVQYYDLTRAANDIEVAIAADLPLVNFATEAVSTERVAREIFGRELPEWTGGAPVEYDMRTRHAYRFGRPEGSQYLMDADEVLDRLRAFVAREEADA